MWTRSMTTPSDAAGPGLWDWALEAYQRPGVAEACLSLQDEHGLSVAYLLWAAWAGEQGDEEAGACAAAAAIALAWEEAALRPLRAARRGLKRDLPGVAAAARLALRARLQEQELAAERLLLAALADLPRTSGAGALAVKLARAAAVWGADEAAAPSLERLAKRLAASTA